MSSRTLRRGQLLGTLGSDGRSGTFALGVFDFETPRDQLRLRVRSSNTALVPRSDLVLGGSGAARTLAIRTRAGGVGTSTLTVSVTDGAGATGKFTIRVVAGTSADDALAGSEGSDLLLGAGGDDQLIGQGGFDLLAGGGGNDVMIGGEGTDAFRGNAGLNSVTDLRLDLGETMLEAENRA